MKKGTILNIQKFCLDDGPGIRTTIFLKGCPLKCLWCHNPESQTFNSSLSFTTDLCIKCGGCATVCKNHVVTKELHTIDRLSCVGSGKCSKVCPTKALELTGTETTVEEILPIILTDLRFYEQSQGGVTISGGEPFAQIEFLVLLLKAIKQYNIHVCIETCGFTSKDNIMKILPYVDIFLYDFKESDEKRHKEYTGVSNKTILENLEFINESGKEIILRCPIIPNYNDREDHFVTIKLMKKRFKSIKMVQIMPFHQLGMSKLERYGINKPELKTYEPSKKQIEDWIDYINK